MKHMNKINKCSLCFCYKILFHFMWVRVFILNYIFMTNQSNYEMFLERSALIRLPVVWKIQINHKHITRKNLTWKYTSNTFWQQNWQVFFIDIIKTKHAESTGEYEIERRENDILEYACWIKREVLYNKNNNVYFQPWWMHKTLILIVMWKFRGRKWRITWSSSLA